MNLMSSPTNWYVCHSATALLYAASISPVGPRVSPLGTLYPALGRVVQLANQRDLEARLLFDRKVGKTLRQKRLKSFPALGATSNAILLDFWYLRQLARLKTTDFLTLSDPFPRPILFQSLGTWAIVYHARVFCLVRRNAATITKPGHLSRYGMSTLHRVRHLNIHDKRSRVTRIYTYSFRNM